jgi:hypothetical protein
VDDGCLDGLANVVAIPNADVEGKGSRQFESPLSFPSSANVPAAINPKFIEPFGEQATTLTWADTALVWDPKPRMTGVDMGQLKAEWAGCTAEFEFSFSGTPEKAGDDVQFVGQVGFTLVSSNKVDECPDLVAVAAGEACTVNLNMTATRQ